MSAGTIEKPQMRRLFKTAATTALLKGVVVSMTTGLIWYFVVMEPRKRRYAEFYKTYDPEAKLKIMCDAGLMQSCGPNATT